jgi:hypothetical protein
MPWCSQAFFCLSLHWPTMATLSILTGKSSKPLSMSAGAILIPISRPLSNAFCKHLMLLSRFFRLQICDSSPSEFQVICLGPGDFLLWTSMLSPSFYRRHLIVLRVFSPLGPPSLPPPPSLPICSTFSCSPPPGCGNTPQQNGFTLSISAVCTLLISFFFG